MELEAVLKSEEVQREQLPYAGLMKYLEEYSGKSIKNADDVADMYGSLDAEVNAISNYQFLCSSDNLNSNSM